MQPPPVLTIAGSDSGGAAGAQADLKSFLACGVYGMSVLTVITAQNSVQVAGAHFLPPDFVRLQLETVLADYGAAAVKTGFVGKAPVVALLGELLDGQANLVVDPVLVNYRQEPMFGPDVTAAYRKSLIPIAWLVTPNRTEAALLTNRPVETLDEMLAAGRMLLDLGARAVLVKGGRAQEAVVDILVTPKGSTHFISRRVETKNTHGSGDTLSAAAAAYLARGLPLPDAVKRAHQYTARAIIASAGWWFGSGHGPVAHGVFPE